MSDHSPQQPPSYLESVDERTMAEYLAYQQRYADEPRESDKVTLSLIARLVDEAGVPEPTILDIGCSNGLFLSHLAPRLPRATLVGGDLSADSIEACRADSRLAGITFAVRDITTLAEESLYDVIVANAVLFSLNDEQFEAAANSISAALKPGGAFVAFDFAHEFSQELEIVERSRSHPGGIVLRFRSTTTYERVLGGAGFAAIDIAPFRIPIDLDPGHRFGRNESGFEDLNSYTVRSETGDRLLFRGTLFQPWCHLVAKKDLG